MSVSIPGVCARAFREPALRLGLGLRMSRQRVRRFVRTGRRCGLHFLLAVLGTSWRSGGCCKERCPRLRLCGVWSLPSAKHFSSGCGAGGKGVGEGRKDGHAGRGASAAGAVRASLADPRLPPVSLGVAVCELPGILPAKVSEHRLGISFLCRVHVGSGAGKPGRPVFSGWRRAEPFSEVGSQSPRASWGGAVALRTRRNAGRAGGRSWLI